VRYYFDTEFIEDGKTIDLISIGIVAQDGREYYAVSSEFDASKASQWVVDNVLCHLGVEGIEPKPRDQIREEILNFIGSDNDPQFWAWFASYDWVVFCQLFGTMMELPKHFPMYVNDVRQLLGDSEIRLPKQQDGEHLAISDARHVREMWEFLTNE
jgi:hypothetical protein